LKRFIKILFKIILALIIFVLLYLLTAFCLSRITVASESNQPKEISIYLLTNGVHTDIVVPIKSEIFDWNTLVKFENTISKDTNFNFLSMGWGDKGFYLETPQWKDLKAKIAFNAAFGLGNTAIHATFYKEMKLCERCKKIEMSKTQYQRLINYISSSFKKDENGNLQAIITKAVYGQNDAFYEAQGNYSLLHTCNTWANSGLKNCGQKCCLWTPFDTGIFLKY
jgi:uncharacterized protein (TIGR02117 family)